MLKILALLGLAATAANAVELTQANYDELTSGKTVLIKFFAPWCGHCKKLKPDWDKLMSDFAGSSTQLVADVDCTTEGKELCETHGVKGYPTLKWGDPSDLQDYQGGRTYDDLKKFADEKLKPVCGVKNIDLCDKDKKAEILKFQAMSVADLDKLIEAEEKKLEDAEKDFKDAVAELQAKYTAMSEEKDKKIEDVKAAGLGLMKSVKMSAKTGSDEL